MLFFPSTPLWHFCFCFVQRAKQAFIHHSPKAEVPGVKAVAWHSHCTWPSAELAPGCISLPGNHWQMVSLTPASFSPPAGCRDEGLTYSAKCFVKAFFSYGSADFLGVEIINFSELVGALPISALSLIHPAEEPWSVQGFFFIFPPISVLALGVRGCKGDFGSPEHSSHSSPLCCISSPAVMVTFWLSPATCHMLEKTEKLKRVSLKHQRNLFSYC